MSRIGRQQIALPNGVNVNVSGHTVTVKGPKGELTQIIPDCVSVKVGDHIEFDVAKPNDNKQRAFWGTAASLVGNMVQGVSEGFERVLEISGVGYRAEAKGKSVNLSLGFSHPVVYQLPEGVEAATPQPTQIVLSSIDKQKLGQAAAEIRAYRPVEPYKGKGVRYSDERVRRKEGKKAGK